MPDKPVVIIGAGVAGLTAACFLARSGVPIQVY
ncbi:MAG: NAD(P)-binding protein [Anaerolineales bacterium]|nr:NAD(P)-binding protein [Anaerolineales bacterium]